MRCTGGSILAVRMYVFYTIILYVFREKTKWNFLVGRVHGSCIGSADDAGSTGAADHGLG